MRVTAHNRGDAPAPLHVLPQFVFRNTWSWKPGRHKPHLRADGAAVVAAHKTPRHLPLLRTQRERPERAVAVHGERHQHPASLCERCAGPVQGWISRVSDRRPPRSDRRAPRRHQGRRPCPFRCARSRLRQPSGCGYRERRAPSPSRISNASFDARIAEADEFYADLQRDIALADAKLVQRQAFAGMIWSKQYFYFDIPEWIKGDPGQIPPPPDGRRGRNREWMHLNNADIISMPDKWEYPWYAAWDLAFHTLALAVVDSQFAKEQLVLLTREWYMHPNGQMPAYEWAFGDVNPPVHAWATWRVYQIDRNQRGGKGDLAFLERVFHKLMLNFTWWVNRKDAEGRNVFQGGFLGLDNIGVFDRSAQLPTGGHIDQADGTSWMAMYALNLMRIALELAQHNPVYEDVATKFFEHFLHIAEAMNNLGEAGIGLWDEKDEFFYDVLHLPDGGMTPLKVRSMVGLIPLFAVETLEPELLDRVPEFKRRLQWFLKYRPDLASLVSHWNHEGRGHRRLLSLLRGHRMKRLLSRMLDETEFLSDYGIRAISKHHDRHPYVFNVNGIGLERALLCRRNPTRDCLAAIPIGAVRSGSPSTTC